MLVDELRDRGQIETERLDRYLDDFPDSFVEERRRELRLAEIVRDVEDQTVLLRDPFAS